ncbi:MAG: class I SAM-dependent methyltransferase [Bdellovibrionales bacterium]
MQLIERSRCAISGQDDLEPLYTFPKFPVFMGCMDQPETDDLKQDMAWWISRGSGLIQLKNLLPLDVLYPESHGSGAIGALWEKHHRTFAQFIHRLNPSSVLEIGGGHGMLAKEYQSLADIPWTILEPNPSPVEGLKARIIKGFFDERFTFSDSFDVLAHSHVFEHIYEPDQFMGQLSHFMKVGQHLVFSLPNMQVMLERQYNNCINFEHTVLLTETYVEHLLAKHGFRVHAKEFFMDDHSIFYDAVRDDTMKPMALPSGLYDSYKNLYLGYVGHHQKLASELNETIRGLSGPVYLFGAHVFSQYMLAFGLDESKITCLLDNDPNKQGRRLYGTSLGVKSPSCLKSVDKPHVILKAGVYNQEIKNDILKNINPHTVFLG